MSCRAILLAPRVACWRGCTLGAGLRVVVVVAVVVVIETGVEVEFGDAGSCSWSPLQRVSANKTKLATGRRPLNWSENLPALEDNGGRCHLWPLEATSRVRHLLAAIISAAALAWRPMLFSVQFLC